MEKDIMVPTDVGNRLAPRVAGQELTSVVIHDTVKYLGIQATGISQLNGPYIQVRPAGGDASDIVLVGSWRTHFQPGGDHSGAVLDSLPLAAPKPAPSAQIHEASHIHSEGGYDGTQQQLLNPSRRGGLALGTSDAAAVAVPGVAAWPDAGSYLLRPGPGGITLLGQDARDGPAELGHHLGGREQQLLGQGFFDTGAGGRGGGIPASTVWGPIIEECMSDSDVPSPRLRLQSPSGRRSLERQPLQLLQQEQQQQHELLRPPEDPEGRSQTHHHHHHHHHPLRRDSSAGVVAQQPGVVVVEEGKAGHGRSDHATTAAGSGRGPATVAPGAVPPLIHMEEGCLDPDPDRGMEDVLSGRRYGHVGQGGQQHTQLQSQQHTVTGPGVSGAALGLGGAQAAAGAGGTEGGRGAAAAHVAHMLKHEPEANGNDVIRLEGPAPAVAGALATAAASQLAALGPAGHPLAIGSAAAYGVVPAAAAMAAEAGALVLSPRPRSEWELDPAKICIERRLAVGGFGEVFLAKYEGTLVAVKRLLATDSDTTQRFLDEVHMLARLRHPNLLLFMGYTLTPEPSIVTEFMARGSLFHILRQAGNRPPDPRMQRAVAVAVARGMAYLHSRHPPILHLDLKSPNVLVDDRWRVKIADFGLSRMRQRTYISSGAAAGSPEWMAPEVLRCDHYAEAADVFSYGVVLWELLTGKAPWADLNAMQVVGAVGFARRSLPDPTEGDPLLLQLCKACRAYDPSQRPTFTHILEAMDRSPAAGGPAAASGASPAAAAALPGGVGGRQLPALPASEKAPATASERSPSRAPPPETVEAATGALAPPRSGSPRSGSGTGDPGATRISRRHSLAAAPEVDAMAGIAAAAAAAASGGGGGATVAGPAVIAASAVQGVAPPRLDAPFLSVQDPDLRRDRRRRYRSPRGEDMLLGPPAITARLQDGRKTPSPRTATGQPWRSLQTSTSPDGTKDMPGARKPHPQAQAQVSASSIPQAQQSNQPHQQAAGARALAFSASPFAMLAAAEFEPASVGDVRSLRPDAGRADSVAAGAASASGRGTSTGSGGGRGGYGGGSAAMSIDPSPPSTSEPEAMDIGSPMEPVGPLSKPWNRTDPRVGPPASPTVAPQRPQEQVQELEEPPPAETASIEVHLPLPPAPVVLSCARRTVSGGDGGPEPRPGLSTGSKGGSVEGAAAHLHQQDLHPSGTASGAPQPMHPLSYSGPGEAGTGGQQGGAHGGDTAEHVQAREREPHLHLGLEVGGMQLDQEHQQQYERQQQEQRRHGTLPPGLTAHRQGSQHVDLQLGGQTGRSQEHQQQQQQIQVQAAPLQGFRQQQHQHQQSSHAQVPGQGAPRQPAYPLLGGNAVVARQLGRLGASRPGHRRVNSDEAGRLLRINAALAAAAFSAATSASPSVSISAGGLGSGSADAGNLTSNISGNGFNKVDSAAGATPEVVTAGHGVASTGQEGGPLASAPPVAPPLQQPQHHQQQLQYHFMNHPPHPVHQHHRSYSAAQAATAPPGGGAGGSSGGLPPPGPRRSRGLGRNSAPMRYTYGGSTSVSSSQANHPHALLNAASQLQSPPRPRGVQQGPVPGAGDAGGVALGPTVSLSPTSLNAAAAAAAAAGADGGVSAAVDLYDLYGCGGGGSGDPWTDTHSELSFAVILGDNASVCSDDYLQSASLDRLPLLEEDDGMDPAAVAESQTLPVRPLNILEQHLQYGGDLPYRHSRASTGSIPGTTTFRAVNSAAAATEAEPPAKVSSRAPTAGQQQYDRVEEDMSFELPRPFLDAPAPSQSPPAAPHPLSLSLPAHVQAAVPAGEADFWAALQQHHNHLNHQQAAQQHPAARGKGGPSAPNGDLEFAASNGAPQAPGGVAVWPPKCSSGGGAAPSVLGPSGRAASIEVPAPAATDGDIAAASVHPGVPALHAPHEPTAAAGPSEPAAAQRPPPPRGSNGGGTTTYRSGRFTVTIEPAVAPMDTGQPSAHPAPQGQGQDQHPSQHPACITSVPPADNSTGQPVGAAAQQPSPVPSAAQPSGLTAGQSQASCRLPPVVLPDSQPQPGLLFDPVQSLPLAPAGDSYGPTRPFDDGALMTAAPSAGTGTFGCVGGAAAAAGAAAGAGTAIEVEETNSGSQPGLAGAPASGYLRLQPLSPVDPVSGRCASCCGYMSGSAQGSPSQAATTAAADGSGTGSRDGAGSAVEVLAGAGISSRNLSSTHTGYLGGGAGSPGSSNGACMSQQAPAVPNHGLPHHHYHHHHHHHHGHGELSGGPPVALNSVTMYRKGRFFVSSHAAAGTHSLSVINPMAAASGASSHTAGGGGPEESEDLEGPSGSTSPFANTTAAAGGACGRVPSHNVCDAGCAAPAATSPGKLSWAAVAAMPPPTAAAARAPAPGAMPLRQESLGRQYSCGRFTVAESIVAAPPSESRRPSSGSVPTAAPAVAAATLAPATTTTAPTETATATAGGGAGVMLDRNLVPAHPHALPSTAGGLSHSASVPSVLATAGGCGAIHANLPCGNGAGQPHGHQAPGLMRFSLNGAPGMQDAAGGAAGSTAGGALPPWTSAPASPRGGEPTVVVRKVGRFTVREVDSGSNASSRAPSNNGTPTHADHQGSHHRPTDGGGCTVAAVVAGTTSVATATAGGSVITAAGGGASGLPGSGSPPEDAQVLNSHHSSCSLATASRTSSGSGSHAAAPDTLDLGRGAGGGPNAHAAVLPLVLAPQSHPHLTFACPPPLEGGSPPPAPVPATEGAAAPGMAAGVAPTGMGSAAPSGGLADASQQPPIKVLRVKSKGRFTVIEHEVMPPLPAPSQPHPQAGPGPGLPRWLAAPLHPAATATASALPALPAAEIASSGNEAGPKAPPQPPHGGVLHPVFQVLRSGPAAVDPLVSSQPPHYAYGPLPPQQQQPGGSAWWGQSGPQDAEQSARFQADSARLVLERMRERGALERQQHQLLHPHARNQQQQQQPVAQQGPGDLAFEPPGGPWPEQQQRPQQQPVVRGHPHQGEGAVGAGGCDGADAASEEDGGGGWQEASPLERCTCEVSFGDGGVTIQIRQRGGGGGGGGGGGLAGPGAEDGEEEDNGDALMVDVGFVQGGASDEDDEGDADSDSTDGGRAGPRRRGPEEGRDQESSDGTSADEDEEDENDSDLQPLRPPQTPAHEPAERERDRDRPRGRDSDWRHRDEDEAAAEEEGEGERYRGRNLDEQMARAVGPGGAGSGGEEGQGRRSGGAAGRVSYGGGDEKGDHMEL